MTDQRYTLDNGTLRLTLSARGGQPVALSAIEPDGSATDLLWNADPSLWEESAPLLFPIVGRLRGGKWSAHGQEYSLGIHGFARFLNADPAVRSADGCTAVFFFTENEETLASYPFPFRLGRSFTLNGRQVISRVTVENTGSGPMPFTIGLHPGFLVPAQNPRLSFECKDAPRRMLLSPRYFMSGASEPYALRDGKTIDLDNALFADDAIILTDVASVTLDGDGCRHPITVECPGANYFGFWQPVKASPDAPEIPFVCIEPWEALPSFDAPDGTPCDDMFTRPGTVVLAPGETYSYDCRVTVG